MVRLRPHHLLCILTFIGRGYTPAFTANMTRIAARLSAGERVRIVSGPDDICAPLLSEAEPHCHRPGITLRDAAAAREAGLVLGLDIHDGTELTLTAAALADLRLAFRLDSLRGACGGCEWGEICSAVAASGYQGARLVAGSCAGITRPGE